MKQNKKENKEIKFKDLLPYFIIIIVVILIRSFIMTPVIVSGPSMQPTLKNNEIVLLNKIEKEYKRFDIIVINYNKEKLIKRIIGLPGEKIEIIDNVIYINDKVLKDKYGKGITSDLEVYEISNESYFVMGDNREDSIDSRIIGEINKDQIKGKTNFVLFPFKKIGKIK